MPNPLSFGPGIWVQDGDEIRLWGIPFTTRATLVRLGNGQLWIHSPVAPSKARFAAAEALGDPGFVIAPNLVHGAFGPDWQAHYEKAQFWVSPKFTKRHKDAKPDGLLTIDSAPNAWAGEIDFCLFAGHSFMDEVVFLHKPSGTLIVTDIIQRHDPAKNTLFWRLVKRGVGILGTSGTTPRDMRLSFNDRAAARASRDHILSWDFDRIILSHGFNVERDGKAYFEDAMRWLD